MKFPQVLVLLVIAVSFNHCTASIFENLLFKYPKLQDKHAELEYFQNYAETIPESCRWCLEIGSICHNGHCVKGEWPKNSLKPQIISTNRQYFDDDDEKIPEYCTFMCLKTNGICMNGRCIRGKWRKNSLKIPTSSEIVLFQDYEAKSPQLCAFTCEMFGGHCIAGTCMKTK